MRLYGPQPVGDRTAQLNMRADRIHMGFVYAGLLLKATFYLLMFLWARNTESGAAALQGVVYAELATWVVFVLLEAPLELQRILTGTEATLRNTGVMDGTIASQ